MSSFCGAISLLVFFLTTWTLEVRAQAQASPAPQVSGASVESDGSSDSSESEGSGNRARRKGGKQAEGSQAPNKFEADPVLKSRYQVEGRSLEVDPD